MGYQGGGGFGRGPRRGGGFGGGGFGGPRAPVNVGDELDVKIEAVGEKGDGIAKKDGFVLFVPNVREGDEVRIRVTKVLRKVGFAEKVGEGKKSAEEPEQATEETKEESEDFGEESSESEDTDSLGEDSESEETEEE